MKIMQTYTKPGTVIIKMDVLPLVAGSGASDAKRYHTVLDDASPVGFPINGDNDDDDQKWY